MSVSGKLSVGFLIVLVLAAAVSIIGIIGIRGLHESSSYMYEKRVMSLSYVNSAKSAFNKMRFDGRNLVLDSFFDDKKGAIDSMDAFEMKALDFVYWMEQSMTISDTDELIDFHNRIMEQFNEYYLPSARRNNSNCIDDIPEHNKRLLINAEMAYIATVTAKIDSYVTGLVDLNAALAEQAYIDNAWLAQIYIILQIVLLLVAVISAVIVARTIIKGIATPILEASDVLGAIAEGNFEKRITGNYMGEFETIKNSVNDTAKQLSIYVDETVTAYQLAYDTNLAKARVEAASEAMFAGINYASNIQRNILPPDSDFDKTFSDYSIIWKPRDVVGGDIYWLKNFERGTLLCVCDCTGHGTPGALLTMLVTSIFNSVVNEENCADTAQVIYTLDKRLSCVLNANVSDSNKRVKDGCDIAVLFISREGNVTISSAHIRVFVCDGKEVTLLKGQNIYVGEGNLERKEDVEIITLPANAENKYYIASDGLYDQTGGEKSLPFGYRKFQNLILDNHNECQESITKKIWDTFEEYRGEEERLDDFELITFKTQPSGKPLKFSAQKTSEFNVRRSVKHKRTLPSVE